MKIKDELGTATRSHSPPGATNIREDALRSLWVVKPIGERAGGDLASR